MTDASSTGRDAAPDSSRPTSVGLLRWQGGALDLVLTLLMVALAGIGYLVLPAGSLVRVLLSVGVLFFAPGYLLIEAATSRATRGADRAAKAWIAIGTSPAIVGLLALSTALLPGGFRAETIVAITSLGCLCLAGIALWRRAAYARFAAAARTLSPA